MFGTSRESVGVLGRHRQVAQGVKQGDSSDFRVPEPPRQIGYESRARVGIHHRRVSGHQEMAFLPREALAGARPDRGRGALCHRDRPPHRRASRPAPRA